MSLPGDLPTKSWAYSVREIYRRTRVAVSVFRLIITAVGGSLRACIARKKTCSPWRWVNATTVLRLGPLQENRGFILASTDIYFEITRAEPPTPRSERSSELRRAECGWAAEPVHFSLFQALPCLPRSRSQNGVPVWSMPSMPSRRRQPGDCCFCFGALLEPNILHSSFFPLFTKINYRIPVPR